MSFVCLGLLRPGVAAADIRCTEGDRLLSANLLSKALTEYVRLLSADGTLQCAIDGRETIVKARGLAYQAYGTGLALQAAGKKEDARSKYIEAVALDPEFAEARAALDALDKPPVADFAAATELARAGYYGEARTQVIETVKKTGKDVPDNLEFLSKGKPGWWTAVRTRFDPYVPTLTGLAILFAALLLAWRLVPRLYRLSPLPDWLPNKWARRHWSLDIQDFMDGSAGANMGKDVAALVESHLRRFDDSQGSGEARTVTGVVGAEPIPADIGSAAPQLKIISSLVDWVFPPKVLILGGNLHASNLNGPGLTVSLSDARFKEVSHSVTLWGRDYGLSGSAGDTPNSDPYIALAEVAAIWTRFRLEELSA